MLTGRQLWIFLVATMCTFTCSVFSDSGTPELRKQALPCTEEIRQKTCLLPACRCSGEDIPGDLKKSQTPQLVFLTFDDAVTHANIDLYKEILLDRKNPNGYPISVTFFVCHEYTDYVLVHELWRQGHEIALHSITHKSYVDYWKNLNESMWHQEIVQQREQLATFAKIPSTDITGMRAPFLQGGGDNMFSALLHSQGLSYDCSRPSSARLWPYTNNYANDQDCTIPPCPTGEFPGIWTVPMIETVGANDIGCAMVDSCLPVPKTANETFELLETNFLRNYHGNRAPFGIFVHSSWLNGFSSGEIFERRKGYLQFLDYLATLQDTYIVSIARAIEWIKYPTPLDKLKQFVPFKVETVESKCGKAKGCSYRPFQDGAERWFRSCASQCPQKYPWVGNPLGQ